MYNTNDNELGFSLEESFKNILNLAFELQDENNHEEAERYFNVLRFCLGIDFSCSYNITSKDLLLNDASMEAVNSFEAYTASKIEVESRRLSNANIPYFKGKKDREIKRIIRSRGLIELERVMNVFNFMVHGGTFSQEYYEYLLYRDNILNELIRCEHSLENNAEVTEYLTKLENTKKLLNMRIKEVATHLEPVMAR